MRSWLFGFLLSTLVAWSAVAGPKALSKDVIAEESTVLAMLRSKLSRAGTVEIDPTLAESARIAVKLKVANDAMLAFLGNHPRIGSITIADASKCTAKAWATLTRLSNLQRLILGKSTAGDPSAANLAELETLEVLYLGESKITDVGLVRLAALKNLRSLDLFNTRVTDEGVAALAKLTKLEELNLAGTRITNKSLLALSQIKSLKLLRVNRTRVTDAGIRLIEKELPQLIVRY